MNLSWDILPTLSGTVSPACGTHGERVRAWLLRGCTIVLCLTGLLALLGLPLETTEPSLDPSWVEAYVHFTKTGAQAGVDYLFTYGPLAHFIAPAFDPELYTLDLVVAVLMAILLTAPLAWAATRRRSVLTTLCLLWIVGVLVPRSMGNEVGACIAVITTTILLLEDSRKSVRVCALTGVAFAFFSLMKFTLLLMCVSGIGTLFLQGCFAQRKGPERPVWIATLAGSYGVAFMMFWILAGQRPANLGAYLANSIEVSRAYAMGMHTPLDPRLLYLGAAIALLVSAQLGVLLARGKGRLPIPLAAVLFACFALLLTWKMGVARSQPPKFYVPAAAIAVLLAAPRPGSLLRPGLRQCVPVAVLALATSGILHLYGRSLYDHLEWSVSDLGVQAGKLATPMQQRDLHESIYAAYRTAYAFPEIRKIVGSDTVDMFTANQSVVLFNQMNYHPRPVFHGYQACSPRLARLNGAFYTSPEAPKYVMRLEILTPIDGRYPTTEDPEALKALFRNYRPVHWERHFVLLERMEGEPPPAERIRKEAKRGGTARLNEWISLENPGDDWQLLALELRPSLPGRLRSLLFQPPMPKLEVRHSDGTVGSGRINIGSIESGFIINPVFEPVGSVEDWPGASSTRHVEAFRVIMAQGWDWLLQPEFAYSVTTAPPLSTAVTGSG